MRFFLLLGPRVGLPTRQEPGTGGLPRAGPGGVGSNANIFMPIYWVTAPVQDLAKTIGLGVNKTWRKHVM